MADHTARALKNTGRDLLLYAPYTDLENFINARRPCSLIEQANSWLTMRATGTFSSSLLLITSLSSGDLRIDTHVVVLLCPFDLLD